MSPIAVLTMAVACALLKHGRERKASNDRDRRSAYIQTLGGLLLTLSFMTSWQHENPSLALLYCFAIVSPIAMALALIRALSIAKKNNPKR